MRIVRWMMALPACLLTSACDVPRPQGAYESDGFAIGTTVDLDAEVPYEAGSAVPFDPTGSANPNDTADPNVRRLMRLSGRYLMRADLFSTATLPSPANATVPTRTSYMFLTELYVTGNGLTSFERLCRQTFRHACTPDCTVTTDVVPATYPALWDLRVSRNYSVSGTTLTGKESVFAIGYDASKGDALPATASDARVWDQPTGGVREGLEFVATFNRDGLLPLRASCTLATAQRFVVSFTGTLGGTIDEPSLEASVAPKPFVLDRDNVAGASWAIGDSGATCSGKGGGETLRNSIVRFKRAPATLSSNDDFWTARCPEASAWDDDLPAELP